MPARLWKKSSSCSTGHLSASLSNRSVVELASIIIRCQSRAVRKKARSDPQAAHGVSGTLVVIA